MQDFTPLTSIKDMKPGSMKLASVNGTEYLVARIEDRYYVTQSRCPHLGGRLEQGKLDGAILQCPRHNSQFDLRDGHVVRWTDWQGTTLKVAKAVKHPRGLRTYAVKVEGDTLLLGPEKTTRDAG